MNTMRNRPRSSSSNSSNVAGMAAAVAIGAVFALVAAPLGGMVFLAVLVLAIAALSVCIWTMARNRGASGHGTSDEGGHGAGASHDDGMPAYLAGSTYLDSVSSDADDEQRSCRFDAPSDSGGSDYGSDSDCGSGSSDSGSSSDSGGGSSSD